MTAPDTEAARVAEIAEKLTSERRAALVSGSRYFQKRPKYPLRSSDNVLLAMADLRLFEHKLFRDGYHYRLTSLGLAVRAHLTKDQQNDG